MNDHLALHVLRDGAAPDLPVVLLHGFPIDHRMWLDVAPLLPADRRVLAVDLPGFGASPPGDAWGAASGGAAAEPGLEVMADAVTGTLAAHGVARAVVVGLSMGGYVAMALLDRHPDVVAGLALLDTRSTADDDAARRGRLDMAETVLADGDVAAAMDHRWKVLGRSSRSTRPELAERIGAWIRDQPPAAVAWAQRAMAARPDRTEVLRGYDGPATVLVGAEDEVTPLPQAEHMAHALRDVELVVVPHAGHMPPLEAPAEVAEALARLVRRVTA